MKLSQGYNKGVIIAIEGLDGSGKTTQSGMLVERLNGAGHEAVYIRPLYLFLNRDSASDRISPRRARTAGANICKRILMSISGYFYALACYLKMRLGSGRGKVVVCDRYFYQFFFDLFGRFSTKIVAIFPRPDIVFSLTGEPEAFYARMTSPSDQAVGRDYYQMTGKLFDILSEKYGFIKIDAGLSQGEVNDVIFEHLSGRLEK